MGCRAGSGSGIGLAVVVFAGALAALNAQAPSVTPVTDAMLQDPPAESWLMWRRTLNAWGFSPLDEIDRTNVGELQMVWSRGLGPGLQQGTPLVPDGVLYMPHPRDIIEAIDAATGELAWETEILDYRVNPANQSSGPIIANGKIVSGRGCTPRGGPNACVIVAHDARTGEELWRRRTIPAPGEPGDESWGGVPFEERKHVGSWMVPSFDPELNLVYAGTSVTSPAPKFMLGGTGNKHLYHNSTLALDADTGEIVWYYQHLNDSWISIIRSNDCSSIPRWRPTRRPSTGSTRASGRARSGAS